MENKTKIAVCVFLFIFSMFNQSCNNSPIRNPELCIKNEEGNWLISPYDSIFIKVVTVDGKEIQVEEIIDIRTFDFLYKYKEDSVKFKNAFYSHNPSKIYFKDKNFLYFLVKDSLNNYLLDRKCGANDYEMVGGEYIKIFPNVYWQVKRIANADYHTFKSINVLQNKSEWAITVGLDKRNIFYGDQIMQKDMFESLFWEKKDSLRTFYNY